MLNYSKGQIIAYVLKYVFGKVHIGQFLKEASIFLHVTNNVFEVMHANEKVCF